jgi:hypothetical protein
MFDGETGEPDLIDVNYEKCVGDIARSLKSELHDPAVGYVMFTIIIVFIDLTSASDALISGYISIMFAFFFLLVGLQYRLGTEGYVLVSIMNGFVVSIVGIYNRGLILNEMNSDSGMIHTARELFLMKRSIGGEIFTLSTFLLVFSFELVVSSLYGTLRKSQDLCDAIAPPVAC